MKRPDGLAIGKLGGQKACARKAADFLTVCAAKTLISFCAVMREIFDESAYERFLVRIKSERTSQSYREFLSERESTVCRKPRCC